MSESTRRSRGLAVIRALGFPEAGALPNLNERFWGHTLETIFSDLWGRPQLSLKHREMITLGVLVAAGSDLGVRPHFRTAGPELGVTRDECFEIILQAMYYAGWHNNQAFFRLREEIESRPDHPWKGPWQPNPPGLEDPQRRRDQGLQTLRKLGLPEEEEPIRGAKMWDYTLQTAYCDLWSRQALSLRDREMVTIGILVSIGDEVDLRSHFRDAAPHVGLTLDECVETILHAVYYSGWPRRKAFNLLQEEIDARPDHPWKNAGAQ
jgi:4-carboxymuconolactone decarboxylase